MIYILVSISVFFLALGVALAKYETHCYYKQAREKMSKRARGIKR